MLPFAEHKLSIPVLALLISHVVAGPTLAQTATPAAYPMAPDASECVIAPAPINRIVAMLGTPDAEPAIEATPSIPAVGEPADAETSADVRATLHQLFACANAGDPQRVASFFTDDLVRDFFGGVPLEDLLSFITIPPQPLPEDQKRIIVRFGEVQLLPDGRAGVMMVLNEPDDPRTEEPDYAILRQVEEQWLVDEIHEDGGATGTPVGDTPVA